MELTFPSEYLLACRYILSNPDQLKNTDLKTNILDLKEEILSLRTENVSLKEELQKQKQYNMVFENDLYWNVKENEEKEGPYCTKCWDSQRKSIRMHNSAGSMGTGHCYKCPECDTKVYSGQKPAPFIGGALL